MSDRYRSRLGGFILIGLIASVVFSLRGRAAPTSPGVELKTVKYEQLTDAVKAARGKVVVVDAWGTFCPPCKAEFPHLVEMQEKYGADGLVCISVCIPTSDSNPEKDRPEALKFLTDKKATFQNFLLENGWKICNDKWGIEGVPATFVFDRDGRRVKKFNSGPDPETEYDMKDVEKVVVELLRPKK
jgi:thiol-disulfide isomerase/thioredoxin